MISGTARRAGRENAGRTARRDEHVERTCGMMGDAARALETERDYRKQVRKAYYMREEDFATLREYNDYLEEVEDIVYELLHEETRNAGRAKLDARRVASSEVTARNRAKLEADKRALSESISSQARHRPDPTLHLALHLALTPRQPALRAATPQA